MPNGVQFTLVFSAWLPAVLQSCLTERSGMHQRWRVGSGVSVCVNKGKRGDVDSKSSSVDF